MKVLLLALGNAPARLHFESIHCENYLGKIEDGHEIITFGYNDGVDIKLRPEDDFNEAIKRLPVGWSPDCCVLWEADWNLLPKNIDLAPCPVVVIPWDWDFDVPLSRAIVQSADISIGLAEFERQNLENLGGNGELFYPIGIMKKYYAPSPKKIKDRKYDLFYTSTIDSEGRSDRAAWILRLCSLSDKYNVFFRENLPSFNEYVEALRESKLVLSYHRYGSMSGRLLEAGAQGTVVLETGSEVNKHFRKNDEYISINETNFREQIEKYLNNIEKLQEISDNVYKKVTEKYEARDQFVGLLNFLEDKFRNSKKRYRRKASQLTESERHNRNGEVYYYTFYRCTRYFIMNTGSKLLELSMDEFKRAASIGPSPRIMTNLAVAMSSYIFTYDPNNVKERSSEVTSILKKVISSAPGYIMAYYNLGLIHYRTANFAEAVGMFNRAILLMDAKEGDFDPWCLHNRDFDIFEQVMRKPLNVALTKLCTDEKGRHIKEIKNLFRSIMFYLLSIMEESGGNIRSALDAIRAAYNSCNTLDTVAVRAAKLTALLGFENESLKIYEKVITLLPFNMLNRMEYFELLYLSRKDRELINAINNLLRITSTVTQLKDTTPAIRRNVAKYSRLGKKQSYSFDMGREKALQRLSGLVFDALKKEPRNIDLLERAVNLWFELDMKANALKVMEEFMSSHLSMHELDQGTVARLRRLLDKFKVTPEHDKLTRGDKLKKFRDVMYSHSKFD